MGKSFNKNKESLRKLEMFADREQNKMFAVFKQSVKDLIDEANKTVQEGGHMRVDTGFLRISGVSAINEIPRGETEGRKRRPGEVGILYPYNTASVNVMLAKLKLGDIFYFGWTARYAIYREFYDGFLETACQKWKQIVESNKRRVDK